jgi:hypothetical protein
MAEENTETAEARMEAGLEVLDQFSGLKKLHKIPPHLPLPKGGKTFPTL